MITFEKFLDTVVDGYIKCNLKPFEGSFLGYGDSDKVEFCCPLTAFCYGNGVDYQNDDTPFEHSGMTRTFVDYFWQHFDNPNPILTDIGNPFPYDEDSEAGKAYGLKMRELLDLGTLEDLIAKRRTLVNEMA